MNSLEYLPVSPDIASGRSRGKRFPTRPPGRVPTNGRSGRLTAGASHSCRIALAYDLYARNADGTGDDELLVKSPHTKFPLCWSPDGKFLVYSESDNSDTRRQTWVLPMEGNRKPIPFFNTGFNVDEAKLSPVPDSQGRLWMAYLSNETGSPEVYLRPFLPGGPVGAAVRVSPTPGNRPFWRKDGKELFYAAWTAGNWKQMAVDVKLGQTPKIGVPHVLFDLDSGTASADGQRFLSIQDVAEIPAARINVVLNWTAQLAGK